MNKQIISSIALSIIVFQAQASKLFPQYKHNGSPFYQAVQCQTVKPATLEELTRIISQAAGQKRSISICGAGQSQGNQTRIKNGIQVDMAHFNKILAVDCKRKTITVEPQITWRKIQEHINPLGLAVKAMQSYADFTVGGSVSVNAHGLDYRYTVADTVVSMKVLLSNGMLVTCDRTANTDLFNAVRGGYGLCGVITEVTLELTDNIMLKKESKIIKSIKYGRYFEKHIKGNPDVQLHSTRLLVDPNQLFDKMLLVTYYKAETTGDIEALETPSHVSRDQTLMDIMRRVPLTKKIRMVLEKMFIEAPTQISRNNAMSSTIKSLESADDSAIDILQEYFIPCSRLPLFLMRLKNVVLDHKINLINATIRYIPATHEAHMTYAPVDSFAIVLYIHLPNSFMAQKDVETWTQKIINASFESNGRYYLPYHLYATKEQLYQAYPQFNAFLDIKKKYDPISLFANELFSTYVLKNGPASALQ